MILLAFLSVFALGVSKSDAFDEYGFNSDEELSTPYRTQMLFTKYESDLDNEAVTVTRTTRTFGVQDINEIRAVLKQVLPNLEEDITLAPKEDLTFSVIYNQLESTEPSKKHRTMYVYPIYTVSRTPHPHPRRTSKADGETTAEKEKHVHLAEDPEGKAIFRVQSDEELSKENNDSFENKTNINLKNYKLIEENAKKNILNSNVGKKVIEKVESVSENSNDLIVFDLDNNRFLTDLQEDVGNDNSKNNKYFIVDKNDSQEDRDDHQITVEMKDEVDQTNKKDVKAGKKDIIKKTYYKINNSSNDVLNKNKTPQNNTKNNNIDKNADDFLDNSKKRIIANDQFYEIDHNEAKTDAYEIKTEESSTDTKLTDRNDVTVETGEIIYIDDKENGTTDSTKENVVVVSKIENDEKNYKLANARKDGDLSNYGDNVGYGNLEEASESTLSDSREVKTFSTVNYLYYDDDEYETKKDTNLRSSKSMGVFEKDLIEYGLTIPTHTGSAGRMNQINESDALRRRKKPRRRKTTTKRFDIAVLLEYIKNLTADYNVNLTQKLNTSFQEYSIPTCPQYNSTATLPTTTTVVTTEKMSNITGTIMGKCFVCGLDVRGIPTTAPCSDAFAPDVIPLLPVNPTSRAHIAQYRKYCRYMDIPHYHLNTTEPKNLWGRWTGGCSVRWIDITGVYTQRSCRNRNNAIRGRHFVSRRMSMLEMALQSIDNGCIISPMASLVPLSRGISLFARFHACVCTGSWCNRATRTLKISPFALLTLIIGYL